MSPEPASVVPADAPVPSCLLLSLGLAVAGILILVGASSALETVTGLPEETASRLSGDMLFLVLLSWGAFRAGRHAVRADLGPRPRLFAFLASQLQAVALTALGIASAPPLTAANLTGWMWAAMALLAVSALVAPISRTAPDAVPPSARTAAASSADLGEDGSR